MSGALTGHKHALCASGKGLGSLVFSYRPPVPAVRAVVSATSYALDIATQNGPAELQPQDELALRSLARGVDGCCTQPGTCKQLKELLAGSTPLLALCYRDGNLCDTDGRLLSLDLSHQVNGGK